MGVEYLWDTNTVIYFLQKQFTVNTELFIDGTLEYSPPTISAITEIELLCWKTTNSNNLNVLHSFINDANVIELEKSIKLKTPELRRIYKIKLPDAVIAATAKYIILHSLHATPKISNVLTDSK